MALHVEDGLPLIETAAELAEAMKTEWSLTTLDASTGRYELGRFDAGADLCALEIDPVMVTDALALEPGSFRAASFATAECGVALHIFHVDNVEAMKLASQQNAKVSIVQW